MKILKGPSRKFDPLYYLTCSVCESIIECNRSELSFNEALNAKEQDYYLMTCPACSKSTVFDYQIIGHFEIKD